MVLKRVAIFLHFVLDSLNHDLLGIAKLFLFASERNHDFRLDIMAEILAGLEGSLDDGGSLHPVDFRIGNAETNSAEAHHRVGLMELIAAIAHLLLIATEGLRDFGNLGILVDVRKELVKRRIE